MLIFLDYILVENFDDVPALMEITPVKSVKRVDEDVWLTALVPKEIFNALMDYGKKHQLGSMSVVARQAFAFFLEHGTSKDKNGGENQVREPDSAWSNPEPDL